MISVMLVLIGMQFICFGLLAEMMARTYHESQDKKIYAIREVIQANDVGTTNFPNKKVRAIN